VDHTAIMNILMVYGLLPKPDNTHFTEDKERNHALETLYKACNLKY
jgi:hypothetical protein